MTGLPGLIASETVKRFTQDGARIIDIDNDVQGKKVNWRDGFNALRCIKKYNLSLSQ